MPPARGTGKALITACGVAIVACSFPWSEVAVPSLWGEGPGPRGLHTTAGFTCLITCVLCAMLTAFEGASAQTREASRTACVTVMAIAAIAIAQRILRGAGALHGFTAVHTHWFWWAVIAVTIGTGFGWTRFRARRTPPVGDVPPTL